MKGYWIYGVYSFNPKNHNTNMLKYFKDHAKAEAYAIFCDRELRPCGRYSGVRAIWVEE